ncbi:hypothetical protein HanRHA438_Chr10g0441301 [Helianthus annuus]|nr:hypothetical protein HanRHA438_Chr10g0441301 [Helianthus annuus]
MASMSPGNDRRKRSRGWLCHTVEQFSFDTHCPTGLGFNSFTVNHVLKYSLNRVISPSFRVHTCTQYTCAPS